MVSKVYSCFSICILILAGCNADNNAATEVAQHKKDFAKQASRQADSCKIFLKDGCVVLRRGNDIISEIFSQLNKTDKTFSHCGIAFHEKNVWYVYHSIGGEDNPDERLRKDTYENFVISSHNNGFGICNLSLTDIQAGSLHTIVDSMYQKKVPFDMKFDLNSDDRLYCAEMVYKAIQKATANDTFFTTTFQQGFKFVSTDNIFVNKQGQILCRVIY